MEEVDLGREYPKYPLVGVGALIKKGDSILLVKRSYEPGMGLWSIPGGLIEVGEVVQDAVKREVREEVGLEIEVERLLDVVDNIVYDREGRVRFHYVLIDFLAYPVKGEAKAVSEVLDVKWVKASELSQYKLTKTALKLLRKIGFI